MYVTSLSVCFYTQTGSTYNDADIYKHWIAVIITKQRSHLDFNEICILYARGIKQYVRYNEPKQISCMDE